MTLKNKDYAAIHNALETAAAIMKERTVIDMAGEAYFTDEAEKIQRGIEAFQQYDANPLSHAARYRNEAKLAEAGKAIDIMDILLTRNGFAEMKDRAWTDHDREVIQVGLQAFQQATQHCRN